MLDLPPSCKIHLLFHISQLKSAKGSDLVPTDLPPHLNAELELVAELEALLGVRYSEHNPQHVE